MRRNHGDAFTLHDLLELSPDSVYQQHRSLIDEVVDTEVYGPYGPLAVADVLLVRVEGVEQRQVVAIAMSEAFERFL